MSKTDAPAWKTFWDGGRWRNPVAEAEISLTLDVARFRGSSRSESAEATS